MKKIIQGVLACMLSLSFVGCANNNVNTKTLKIATTSHALAYFIGAIGSTYVDVSYELTGNPHSFELTQQEANAISQSTIFMNVEVGDYQAIGEQIRNVNPKLNSIDVSEGIDLLIASEDHDHEHEETHDESHHLTEEYDPHMWLDPIRAKELVMNITKYLSELDAEHAIDMQKNAEGLLERLDILDGKFEEALKNKTKEDILVSHAAYTYLADRYQFEQKGINSNNDHSENTQQSIIELDTFIQEHHIQYILLEENIEATSIVNTLVKTHNLQTLRLHNMETEQTESDYFILMVDNLKTLEQALNS